MRKIFTYLAAFMLPMAVWGQEVSSETTTTETDVTVVDGKATVSTAAELSAAISNSNVTTIELGADITDLEQMLTINRSLEISGGENGYVISGAETMTSTYKHIINIEGENIEVTLSNITLSNAGKSGLNAQEAKLITLKNVRLIKNKEAGMIVHCPVVATGLITEGNNWGGVNVDESKDTNDGVSPSLTIDASCSFKESAQIWSDDATDASEGYVKVTDCDYKYNVFKWNGKDVNQRFWAKDNNTISDVASLRMAVAVGVNVNLSAGTYELDKQLVVDKPMTINGVMSGETIIKASESWTTHSGDESPLDNLISLEGLEDFDETESANVNNISTWTSENSIRLSNLTIQGSKRNGLNVYQAPALLENVKLLDNAAAGMVVQSKVFANNVTTEGNKWYGVNVDKGENNTHKPVFVFDPQCKFNEELKVYSDGKYADIEEGIIYPSETWGLIVFKPKTGNNSYVCYQKNKPVKVETIVKDELLPYIDRVTLGEGTFELSKQLVISSPITISGRGMDKTVLTANAKGDWPGEGSSKKNLVSLGGKGDGKIVFNDLTIQNSVASGMNAQTGYAVVLNNVAFKNNTNAGLLVHGSVKANGIVTEGNGWGGVNIDKGTPEHTESFTFDNNCIFNEDCKIWSELVNDNNVVTVPNTTWTDFIANNKRYWTNEKVAEEGEINVVYEVKIGEVFTDKATIKVKYGDKPALSYSAVPKDKPIQIIVEPMVGYTLSNATVTVNGGTELTATENYVYDYTVGNDGVKIKAVVTLTGGGSIPKQDGVSSEDIKTSAPTSVDNPTVVANQSVFTGLKDGEKVVIISKEISKEDDEFETYIKAINANFANAVAYDIAPFTVDGSDNVTGKTNVAEGESVKLAFPYPAGYNKSDLESVTVYHFADNGDIESYTGTLNDNYIFISGVKSFSPFVLTYTVAEPPVVITYHDLHITESVGAKLVSRNGKDRTPDGGSFTLSLEKEEGYEDCEPIVYYKRGRFGDWNELKLDEVSGYYQIRSVYTDIYVKVSGDGIWPVSNEEVEAQEVKVYTQNGAIVVSTPSLMDVQIISMTGAQVAADKVAGQREFRNLAEGIYVVRVGEEIVKVRL